MSHLNRCPDSTYAALVRERSAATDVSSTLVICCKPGQIPVTGADGTGICDFPCSCKPPANPSTVIFDKHTRSPDALHQRLIATLCGESADVYASRQQAVGRYQKALVDAAILASPTIYCSNY